MDPVSLIFRFLAILVIIVSISTILVDYNFISVEQIKKPLQKDYWMGYVERFRGTTEDHVEAARLENLHLLKKIDEICTRYNIEENYRRKSSDQGKCSGRDCSLFVNKEYGFMFCMIPKVGTTTLKTDLLKMSGIEFDEYSSAFHKFVNEDDRLTRMSPNYLKKRNRDRYLKFMMVRHPFVRLASGYNDKVNSNDFIREFQLILKQYRKKTRDINAKTVTFRVFVHYLLTTPMEHWDIHWQPYWYRCSPCTVNYDYIGKMENFQRDKRFIYQELEVPNIEIENWFNRKNSKTKLSKLYGQLNEEELLNLYTLFKYDFLLFGYSPEAFLNYVHPNMETSSYR